MFACAGQSIASGFEAVDAMRAGAFDLILMDIKMPRMDGLEATRRIRTLTGPASAAPIVALTANADPWDAAEYLQAGMDAVVEKRFAEPRRPAGRHERGAGDPGGPGRTAGWPRSLAPSHARPEAPNERARSSGRVGWPKLSKNGAWPSSSSPRRGTSPSTSTGPCRRPWHSARAEIPEDAFTAQILGTERAGNGVVIRDDGLVLTIGYLITEASTSGSPPTRATWCRPSARLRPGHRLRPGAAARASSASRP